MAGVKGRSGGPRKNAGGARPGAGRKPKPNVPPVRLEDQDMLAMLQRVALGHIEATPLQVRAAIAAVQYTHQKVGDAGKKEARGAAAEDAAKGRFKPAQAPQLKLVR